MYYFGYDVKFVMNITDIDEKVILPPGLWDTSMTLVPIAYSRWLDHT